MLFHKDDEFATLSPPCELHTNTQQHQWTPWICWGTLRSAPMGTSRWKTSDPE